MFVELTDYEEQISLIQGSGIQFMDFAMKLDVRREDPGEFVRQAEAGPLARLLKDDRKGILFHPAFPGKEVASALDVPIDESMKLFTGVWLPMPFFRTPTQGSFDTGPSNWARMRIIKINEGEDQGNNTHRITLAFDTKVFENRHDTAYLAPTNDDVRVGAAFRLAHQADGMGWFLDLLWVDAWLKELFMEQASRQETRKHPDDIDAELAQLYHQAHYLNLLYLIGTKISVPAIKVVSNQTGDLHQAVPVDMVLDVGNSRTCGILIEDHPQQNDGLSKRYELQLRDLTEPERVYRDPFESRIEFAQVVFGKDNFSVQSGRSEAFLWPTIARVGPEAARLASRRRGTEGSTGLSSPKRYLWDEDKYDPGWRFNCTYTKLEIEPLATAAPIANLINDRGQALYELDEQERMPAFRPYYSRSSLMTFMLAEILSQALMQMNNPAQRLRMSHSNVPRHLRSINLTVPPSMAKPEREIFAKCMEQAVGLVWKSFGWDPTDDKINVKDEAGRKANWPWLPEIHVQWDEATCAQAVYLFNEIHNNFSGRPDEFFATMARPDRPDKRTLTIASIDIGGGTTDLVITEYGLNGIGSNVSITPTQLFRDGFKIAGDDILLDVINQFVIPALYVSLVNAGIKTPEAFLSRLIGTEPLAVNEEVLRQQLTLQVFAPLGLILLQKYEQYDPLETGVIVTGNFGDLLQTKQPTSDVVEYFNNSVRKQFGINFDILSTPLEVPLRRLQEAFIGDRMNICKTIKALCEVVCNYPCDVLLLTGRPSRLPGVLALFKKLLPLPVGRIQPLNHYRTGGWYPFNKLGFVEDPKTTAAVGAMICLLSRNLRLPNFSFRSAVFKPYSTLKFFGILDNNNVLKAENVIFTDIDLDNPDYELPDRTFELTTTTRLGFRQLAAERWSAAPLYILSIEEPKVRTKVANGLVLQVRLGIKRSRFDETNESFEFLSAESDEGSVSRKALKLRLNTLVDSGLGTSHYWLDSGSVYRK